MKLRVLPLIITLLASSVLLFGGWFVYRSYAMENPLAHVVDRVQGVQAVDSQFSKNTVTVHVKLGENASLRELYQTLTNDGASLIGGRQVDLKVESVSSPVIDKWWSSALFDVAQAMETKHYSEIPDLLKTRSAAEPGLSVYTEMDETNVYIRITEGGNNKYVILPRIPAKLGVWPNA